MVHDPPPANHAGGPSRASWAAAQAAAEAAIATGGGGQPHHDLAIALFWQGEIDPALAAMERAHALFRSEGATGRAAWSALWLAGNYLRLKGDHALAAGWIARCERLLENAPPSAELGRVLLVRSLASADPQRVAAASDRALALAQEFGDRDYEALALAYGGLARLSLGAVDDGRRRLDEAMAAIHGGEVRAPEAIGQIYCALLSACERTVDFDRALTWRRVAEPFLDAYGDVGVTGTCRATYAGVLTATGEWDHAEAELRQALKTFDAWAHGMRADAIVRLAGLRVRQGRLDTALRLLEGNEAHPDAQLPLAELELARGRAAAAAGILERRLRQLGARNLEAAPVLLRLVEAHLVAGGIEPAKLAAGSLARLARRAPSDCLAGLAELAAGWVLAAAGANPVPSLERALDRLERARMPLEAADARLALAEASAPHNPDFAIREAKLAMRRLAAIGARPRVDRARSVLRRLGVRVPAGGSASGRLSRREQEVARLVAAGLSNDEIAARLFLSPRTVEHHVSNILSRLDATRRAEIAAYAARHLEAEGGFEK